MAAYSKSYTERYRIDRFTANQAPISQAPLSGPVYRSYTTGMNANTLPNWRNIIAKGGNATTSLWAYKHGIEVKYANSKVTFQSRVGPGSLWESKYSLDSSWANVVVLDAIGHFTSLNAALVGKAKAKAIQRLYQSTWSAHHQLQGGVVAGEIGKTVALIAKTATGIRKGLFDYLAKAVGIRRGKGSNKSKRKAIADSYLETVFGWQPLIHDCKDLAEALGRLVYESDRVRLKAFAEEEVLHSKAVGSNTFGVLYVNQHMEETCNVKAIYKGFLQGPKYEAGSPPAERIVSMLGFDLRSFVPTLWELTPYSFLVDYFTNIGDLLQSFCTDTSGVHGLWYTEIWESKRTYTLNPNPATTVANLTSVYGAGNVRDISVTGGAGSFTIYKREVFRNAVAMPVMVPQFPSLDLSVNQWYNVGALILSKTG